MLQEQPWRDSGKGCRQASRPVVRWEGMSSGGVPSAATVRKFPSALCVPETVLICTWWFSLAELFTMLRSAWVTWSFRLEASAASRHPRARGWGRRRHSPRAPHRRGSRCQPAAEIQEGPHLCTSIFTHPKNPKICGPKIKKKYMIKFSSRQNLGLENFN